MTDIFRENASGWSLFLVVAGSCTLNGPGHPFATPVRSGQSGSGGRVDHNELAAPEGFVLQAHGVTAGLECLAEQHPTPVTKFEVDRPAVG